jgi:hypothetical protein
VRTNLLVVTTQHIAYRGLVRSIAQQVYDPIPVELLMTATWLVLDDFGPSDKVFDWMAERLLEGPTGLVSWGVDYSAFVSSPRWHCAIIP